MIESKSDDGSGSIEGIFFIVGEILGVASGLVGAATVVERRIERKANLGEV